MNAKRTAITGLAVAVRSIGRAVVTVIKFSYKALPIFLLTALIINFYLLNELRRQGSQLDKDLVEAFGEVHQNVDEVDQKVGGVAQELEDKMSSDDVEAMIQDAIDNSGPTYVSAPTPAPKTERNTLFEEWQQQAEQKEVERRLRDLERKTDPTLPDWAR